MFKVEGFTVTSNLKLLKTSYKQSGVLCLRLKALVTSNLKLLKTSYKRSGVLCLRLKALVTSNLKLLKTSYKRSGVLCLRLKALVTSNLKLLKTSYKRSGVLCLRLKALQLQAEWCNFKGCSPPNSMLSGRTSRCTQVLLQHFTKSLMPFVIEMRRLIVIKCFCICPINSCDLNGTKYHIIH